MKDYITPIIAVVLFACGLAIGTIAFSETETVTKTKKVEKKVEVVSEACVEVIEIATEGNTIAIDIITAWADESSNYDTTDAAIQAYVDWIDGIDVDSFEAATTECSAELDKQGENLDLGSETAS